MVDSAQLCVADTRKFSPVISRSLAQDPFEDPIEVSEALKTDFISNLADSEIWVEQELFGFLNAHSREVIGEVHPGNLLEHLAKIERAGIDRPGDLSQTQLLRLMGPNILLGLG